jgi:hypothetical protein
MKSLSLVFAAAALAVVTAPSRADMVITFDFQDYGKNVGLVTGLSGPSGSIANNSHVTFSGKVNGGVSYNPTYTVMASGYNLTNHTATSITLGGARTLFAKFTNSLSDTETGLGLVNGNGVSENEVGRGQAVKLDFTNVLDQTGDNRVSITVSSVQQGEGFEIYKDPAGPPVAHVVASGSPGSDVQTVAFDRSVDGSVFYVTANYARTESNNVLIHAAVSSVPEPSPLVAAGLGLVSIAGYLGLRRRTARVRGSNR